MDDGELFRLLQAEGFLLAEDACRAVGLNWSKSYISKVFNGHVPGPEPEAVKRHGRWWTSEAAMQRYIERRSVPACSQ